MNNLAILLFLLLCAFVGMGGATVHGTHYYLDHSPKDGITWNEDKVK